MDPRWLITAWYLVALGGTITVARFSSVLLSRRSYHWKLKWFLLAPTLSTDASSQARALRMQDIRGILVRTLLYFPTIVVFYSWLPDFVSQHSLPRFLQGYYAVIPLWLVTETIGLISQLCFLPARVLVPPAHKQPWRSRSLAEFWGRRWNRPFSDWFRQVCFRPLRGVPVFALVMAFTVSGLMHELLVDVPLWIVFGTNLFGSMCLYFLIQAGGILFERKWLRQNAFANRIFAWAIIIAPVPLVLNEGTLRIFHFVR